MITTTSEIPTPTQPREFHLGPNKEILGEQVGRVIKLSNSGIGAAFYVDVTDRLVHPEMTETNEEPFPIVKYPFH